VLARSGWWSGWPVRAGESWGNPILDDLRIGNQGSLLIKDSQSRREWGLSALVLLVYGLAVSPIAHALLQHEGLEHLDATDLAWASHQTPQEKRSPSQPRQPAHEHSSRAEDGLEHLTLATHAPCEPPAAPQRLLKVAWNVRSEERERLGDAFALPGMPQGP
jgi:hypothetical protein